MIFRKILVIIGLLATIYGCMTLWWWWSSEPATLQTAAVMTVNEAQRAEQSAIFFHYSRMGFVGLLMMAFFGAIMRWLIVPAINSAGQFEIGENGQPKPRLVVVSPLVEQINPFRSTKRAVIDPSEQHSPALRFYENGKFNYKLHADKKR